MQTDVREALLLEYVPMDHEAMTSIPLPGDVVSDTKARQQYARAVERKAVDYYKAQLRAALAASPQAEPTTEFCWLVELFEPDGNSMGYYHTGDTGLLSFESRTTRDPLKAKRYATKRDAVLACAGLLHLQGVWRAVEHGFISPKPAQAEPSKPELIGGFLIVLQGTFGGVPFAARYDKGKRVFIDAVPWREAPAVEQAQAEPDKWQQLYRRTINEANGLTNYVEDRPELRSAERRIAKIEEEARSLAAAPKRTEG